MVKKPLAIFDVDGTIFRSSLIIEMVEALIEQGLFPARARSNYRKHYENWLDRRGSYEKYIDVLVATFMKYIKGVQYADFMTVVEEMTNSKQARVYRYTRDLIKKLKRENYYLLAISQSPKSVLDKFCKKVGFDKVYGRIYEIGPTARFTGKISDLHLIANKANIVRRMLEKENVTLKNSVGVGDTEGDVPFLELVAKPICFNPNAKLYKLAKINGWQVVVERKDVIYEL